MSSGPSRRSKRSRNDRIPIVSSRSRNGSPLTVKSGFTANFRDARARVPLQPGDTRLHRRRGDHATSRAVSRARRRRRAGRLHRLARRQARADVIEFVRSAGHRHCKVGAGRAKPIRDRRFAAGRRYATAGAAPAATPPRCVDAAAVAAGPGTEPRTADRLRPGRGGPPHPFDLRRRRMGRPRLLGERRRDPAAPRRANRGSRHRQMQALRSLGFPARTFT